jgi:dTDP-glucose 4,6-dehydratase
MNKFKSILITGGAGFIGSHVVRRMVTNYPDTQIFNLDALTYASNLALLTIAKISRITILSMRTSIILTD